MFKEIILMSTAFLIISIYGEESISLKCDDKTTFMTDQPFCLTQDYNKAILPMTNATMDITIVIRLEDIIEVNDPDKTVTLKMYLAIIWNEPRLKLNLNSSAWKHDQQMDHTNVSYSDIKWLDHVWKPDLDMINVEDFRIGNILGEHGTLNLYADKRFWYMIPVEVVLGCPHFVFENYPFDEQTCELFVGSFQYHVEENRYIGTLFYHKENQRPLQYDVSGISALTFEEGLISYKQYYTSVNGELEYEYHNYSRFGVKMTFTRLIQPHLLGTYLPSSLLVVSSWLGFLIEPSSVPGRIALSVTLLLCLVTMR